MDCFLRKLCIAWSELILHIWLQTSVFHCFVHRENPTYLRGCVFCFHAWPLFWCNTTYPFTQVSVQFRSFAQSCPALCDQRTAACQASLSITNCRSLFKLMSIESVMPSNHLILCHPLLLLPSIFPSIRVFFNELVLSIKWPKYWSFSFSISPSNEYSGLIFFRMDWFDLFAVQGTLKSLLTVQKHQFFSAPLCL